VIVPSTAFVSAARAATASVSLSAASASGFVIASQNEPAAPPERDDQTSAAIGSATTTPR